MDGHRLRRQSPAVARGHEERRLGAETAELGDIFGTPDVIDHQKHPMAVQLLAEARGGGVDGLEGGRVLVRPPAEQIADTGQPAGRVDFIAQGGPEDAVGESLADLLVVAELDGQSGLAESAGSVDGRRDAHGGAEQGVANRRVLAALDEGLAGRGHTSIKEGTASPLPRRGRGAFPGCRQGVGGRRLPRRGRRGSPPR